MNQKLTAWQKKKIIIQSGAFYTGLSYVSLTITYENVVLTKAAKGKQSLNSKRRF